MNSNQLKDKIQSEAVELAIKYPYLILELATGTGKTLSFIKAM